MTRSFTFLVNPKSGGGAAPGAVVPVARVLREAGATVDVTYSPGPQAMTALVDEAVGRGDVVVSVGGDGMLSSLAGLVSAAGGTLGVVPAGRGNDFARMLGVPEDAEAQGRVLLEGDVRAVDLVAVSGLGPRRVVAGAVDRRDGHQLEPLGLRRDRAEHRPDEGAVPLGLDPRVEVVRDRAEVEPELLGGGGVAHEVDRAVLLAGEGIAERGHGGPPGVGERSGPTPCATSAKPPGRSPPTDLSGGTSAGRRMF